MPSSLLKYARQLNPFDPAIAEFLGDLYVEREEFGEAVPHYEQAIALVPATAVHASPFPGSGASGRRPLDKAGEQFQIAHRCSRVHPLS